MEKTAQVPSDQCGRENPQTNFDDLENSVPPEESNDELLDQAWDDHTGKSLGSQTACDGVLRQDARVRQSAYCSMLGTLKARWVDIDKGTRYRSRSCTAQRS